METTKINGQLEIDHVRGVIYFHITDEEVVEQLQTVTLLRICRLPAPIPVPGPETQGQGDSASFLDITHMHGANWFKK